MNKSKISSILKQGDCLEILKKLPDDSVDLVVTDPPYEIETSGGGLYNQEDKKYIKELNTISNGFDKNILDELVRVMKKVNIYLFCSQKQIPVLLDYFLKNQKNKEHILYKRKINWNLLSWHKTNPVPACGNKYLSDTEYIMFFREQGVKIYGSFGTKKTHYETPLWVKDKKLYNHPTCKPTFMVENFIVNSSLENEIVLDPFMGSGTTGEASIKNNRKFIGIEIDETYFNTAKERIREVEEIQQKE